ncbi:MAG: polyphosphate polymerase domain-containing protein [Lachnospira sp.]|jgi:hypothetical protein|nr:polyphosphate polymerase domain-containing protein [Lachnospira sp.]
MAIEVFNRCEKKYLLNQEQYETMLDKISTYMVMDTYNKQGQFYKISNIYYDTVNNDIIRTCIDKPVYKEKLRIRSYGVPSVEDYVFVEIKKKYDGIVYKRRTQMQLKDAYRYLNGTVSASYIAQNNCKINNQLLGEIDYYKNFYKVVPKVYLSYDRLAYFEKNDGDFRITFDTNIMTRREDIRLEYGSFGQLLLPENMYLMEIKINRAVPLWFVQIMSSLNIYPISFSKYGTEYKKYIIKNYGYFSKSRKEEEICLNPFLPLQQIIQSISVLQC